MMSAEKQATPHADLINDLLDSRTPKSEREHAAVREIERLRAECEAIKNAISQARSVFDCEPAAKDVLDYVQELAKAKSRNEWERE